MNEWCEYHLTRAQKDKVYVESIKAGINPDDYFEAIEDRYFSLFNIPSDNSLDPGVDVVINEVIEQFKE